MTAERQNNTVFFDTICSEKILRELLIDPNILYTHDDNKSYEERFALSNIMEEKVNNKLSKLFSNNSICDFYLQSVYYNSTKKDTELLYEDLCYSQKANFNRRWGDIVMCHKGTLIPMGGIDMKFSKPKYANFLGSIMYKSIKDFGNIGNKYPNYFAFYISISYDKTKICACQHDIFVNGGKYEDLSCIAGKDCIEGSSLEQTIRSEYKKFIHI